MAFRLTIEDNDSWSALTIRKGMETFADNTGNISSFLKSLKTRIFPDRNIDIRPLLDELIDVGMLTLYEDDILSYYNLTHLTIE